MAKPSAHPGFAALLKEWNQKLADSGFVDIETNKTEVKILKKSGTERRYEAMDKTVRDAKQEFYQRLAQKVKSTPIESQLTFLFWRNEKKRKSHFFESEQEFHILHLYAQGLQQKQIKERLKIMGHRCKIYYPIYRWLKTWGLK